MLHLHPGYLLAIVALEVITLITTLVRYRRERRAQALGIRLGIR